MKIENIIEDIKRDITALGTRLDEQLRKENPGLNFSVSLPGLEDLTTIKTIAILIDENNAICYLSVNVHTHNGNRVFENAPQNIIDDNRVPYDGRHPYQDRFVNSLRDIIKKNKNRSKAGNRSDDFFNDMRHYASSA